MVATDALVDAIEPPKSPSWVPSYSVSSQGTTPLPSPKLDATEVAEQEEAVSVLELPEVEQMPVAEPVEESASMAVVPEVVVITEEVPVASATEVESSEVRTLHMRLCSSLMEPPDCDRDCERSGWLGGILLRKLPGNEPCARATRH